MLTSLFLLAVDQGVQGSQEESAGVATVVVGKAGYQQEGDGVRMPLGCAYVCRCSYFFHSQYTVEWCDH
jgi:hypothetical protein